MFVLLFVGAGGLLSQCWLFQTAEWFSVAEHLSLWLLLFVTIPCGDRSKAGPQPVLLPRDPPLRVTSAGTWHAGLSLGDLAHCFARRGNRQIFLLPAAWRTPGWGEVLPGLLARPVAPTVLLRVIPGPFPPALSTSPDSEPLLNLFLFCEENLLCVVNCGFPISIQSRLSQGFLVMGVHAEGPLWFPSIAVDLFWSAMLCVTSRNLERERGQVCVMRSLCWSNLWGKSWKQVQSPPPPSSKIQRGLPRELGWQNQLN